MTGSKDWSAAVDFSEAQIACRREDYDAARQHLAGADPVFSRPDAEPYQRNALEKLTAASR